MIKIENILLKHPVKLRFVIKRKAIDLFGNCIYLEFNKTNVLMQGDFNPL